MSTAFVVCSPFFTLSFVVRAGLHEPVVRAEHVYTVIQGASSCEKECYNVRSGSAEQKNSSVT